MMHFKISVDTIFNCSLERAFKTPMLCDVTKVHTGYGLMPAIIAVADDQNWGQPGSSKRVFASKSLTFPGGEVSTDTVHERIENKYWKIEVNDFKSWMLGFYCFVGEWSKEEIESEVIKVNYTYTLYSNGLLLYPFQYLFAQLFWKKYMKHAMENIRKLAYEKEPYMYP